MDWGGDTRVCRYKLIATIIECYTETVCLSFTYIRANARPQWPEGDDLFTVVWAGVVFMGRPVVAELV